MTVADEKKKLRARVQKGVDALSPEEKKEKSARVREHLKALPAYRSARRVMLFASMPDEVDMLPLVEESLAEGRQVCLPRVDRPAHRMRLCPVRGVGELSESDYGILEPACAAEVTPAWPDFVLVPGRAFDAHGNRLGRGAGYYDHFLSRPGLRAARVAVAFSCQIIRRVPDDIGDVPVSLVVTENGVIDGRVE